MSKIKITVTGKLPESYGGDLLVYCLGQQKNGKVEKHSGLYGSEFLRAVKNKDFKAKENETFLLFPPEKKSGEKHARWVLFLGLGKSEKNGAGLREKFRLVGGIIAKTAQEIRAGSMYLCLPAMGGAGKNTASAECILEGILLGDYRFEKYKKKESKKSSFSGIKEIFLWPGKEKKGLRHCVNHARCSANAVIAARDMANEPGNGWTPQSFASYGCRLAKQYKLKCTVLSKNHMKSLKMGGILGVNQGSSEPPKIVILEYNSPKKKAQTLLIVGKGLTFDSGGVSLKPGAGMEDMKYDMCGGAAAIAAMAVVGEEKPDMNVIAIIPTTDNMGGSSALKPGDIITHYGGTTSEIINTDAEGRLILADSLAYGIEKFKPDWVIDIATLTGAVIFGLGHHRTGLLGNNQPLIDKVLAAGEYCGEPLWQLPLDKEYGKQIKSTVADIKNTGGRPAGTITAAAYLQKFVGDTPWAHLDIAGTAWDFTKKSYIPKGPSGTGVRTLIELIRSWERL